RDDGVLRVLSRDHEGVDDGWLCDKGRFAYQAIHVDERVTRPMVRDGGELRAVSWERALDEAARGLGRARGSVGAIAGGETTNEEGFLLQRIVREALAGALAGEPFEGRASAAGADAGAVRGLADLLRDAGEDIVIVYGERALAGAHALIKLADGLSLRDRPGAGLLEVPAGTNGRGLREVGVLPDAGPGLAPAAAGGMTATAMARS